MRFLEVPDTTCHRSFPVLSISNYVITMNAHRGMLFYSFLVWKQKRWEEVKTEEEIKRLAASLVKWLKCYKTQSKERYMNDSYQEQETRDEPACRPISVHSLSLVPSLPQDTQWEFNKDSLHVPPQSDKQPLMIECVWVHTHICVIAQNQIIRLG